MTKSKELVSYSWKPLSPEASTFPHTHTHNILREHREPSAHSRTNKPFRLVRVNHAFPIVHDCLEAIGASKCEVMSVLDLRDAYHTLPLAE